MKTIKETSEFKRKMRIYYWKCFISEFSKMCIFFIFFSVFNLTQEYIVALLALMVLRNNGGGLHAKHYLSCLIISFIFLSLSIILGIYIIPPAIFTYVSTLVCAALGYFLVPITSANRPKATNEQRRRCKRKTLFIILIYFISTCICPHNTYLFICYWTIILHILQLIIAHVKEVNMNGYLRLEN